MSRMNRGASCQALSPRRNSTCRVLENRRHRDQRHREKSQLSTKQRIPASLVSVPGHPGFPVDRVIEQCRRPDDRREIQAATPASQRVALWTRWPAILRRARGGAAPRVQARAVRSRTSLRGPSGCSTSPRWRLSQLDTTLQALPSGRRKAVPESSAKPSSPSAAGQLLRRRSSGIARAGGAWVRNCSRR